MFSTPESVAGINTHYTRCTPASRTYQDARHTDTHTHHEPSDGSQTPHTYPEAHTRPSNPEAQTQTHGNNTPTLRTTWRCIHSPPDRPTGPGWSCLRCTEAHPWVPGTGWAGTGSCGNTEGGQHQASGGWPGRLRRAPGGPCPRPGQASCPLLPGRLPARCWDLTRNSPCSRVLLP